MRKQMRRIGIVLLCLWMLCTLSVAAAPLDTEHTCTLSLRYAYHDVTMAGETVNLYRVAEAHADGTFALVAPFTEYKVSIHDATDTEEWKNRAAYLNSCAVADRLTPICTGTIAEDGRVVFSDLQTGLYLVGGMTVSKDSGVYAFDSFLTYLPVTQNGAYVYDVQANPKGSYHENVSQEIEYRVIKLWKDEGHTAQRPASVQVKLYENGQLRETVTLSAENNWTYVWDDDTVGEWTAVEADVPEAYAPTVSVNGGAFTLVNTYQEKDTLPPPPPQTGDTAPLMLYVVLLCLSGLALVLVALVLLRGDRYAKKH